MDWYHSPTCRDLLHNLDPLVLQAARHNCHDADDASADGPEGADPEGLLVAFANHLECHQEENHGHAHDELLPLELVDVGQQHLDGLMQRIHAGHFVTKDVAHLMGKGQGNMM
jgi:hypothetical protein